tara:strand:+ start:2389 stop:4020 length:1632 start_codon:yes stop_codon:yes gene_type:complete
MCDSSVLNACWSVVNRCIAATATGAHGGDGVAAVATAAPITGAFGMLPVELLELVASGLLQGDTRALTGIVLTDAARAAAKDFGRFLRLSKGFGAISHALRSEAAAHGRCCTPRFSPACAHPFLAQVCEEAIVQTVARAFILCLRTCVLGRDATGFSAQNAKWAEFDTTHMSPLLRLSIGSRLMRIDTAWERGGEILCASDAGAIVQTIHGVVAMEGAPARELHPDTALHVAWTCTTAHVCAAASRGSLLALAVMDDPLLSPNDDETRGYTLETWDMARNVRVDAREEKRCEIVNIWFSREGELHRLNMVRPRIYDGDLELGYITLCRSRGTQPTECTCLTDPSENWVATTYCADTGGIALLCSERHWNDETWTQCVVCYDRTDEDGDMGWRHQHVDDYDSSMLPGVDGDEIALSPRGDVLVVLGRGHFVPRIMVYHCNDGRWGIGAMVTLAAAYDCGIPQALQAVAGGHFSPCGSMYVVMARTVHTGVLVVNVRATLVLGKPATCFWRASSNCVPSSLVWSDGIWMQELGGRVVRLGFTDHA